MPTVQTVLGPVADDTLGTILSHEHVLVSLGEENHHYPWRFDWDATRQVIADELREAKAGGIDTLIECSTPDLGRDVRFYEEMARATGMHVVCATGIWLDVPRSFWGRTPDEAAEIFIREIEVGIDDTSIRAGVIKVAHDQGGVPPAGEIVLRGAARASNATGVPITTHHFAREEVGQQQLDILLDEGVAPHRICIGHSADTTDVDYLERLLQAGVYVSLDRYPGRPPSPEWPERNATVRALVERGWAHRLMLGHDHSPKPVPAGAPPEREHPTRYLFIHQTALPALRNDGVTEEQINMMLREAPRRFLAGIPHDQ